MTSKIVASRYAKALFSLGREKGLSELEQFAEQLTEFCGIIHRSPELKEVFRNPTFLIADKCAILKKLAKKLKIKGTLLDFYLLLAEKKRLTELDAINTVFNTLLDQEKGISRGEVATAISLTDDQQGTVLTLLEQQTKRSLVLKFGVSPEILGGVVLKIGDQILDASLRAQLSILKDTIKRGK